MIFFMFFLNDSSNNLSFAFQERKLDFDFPYYGSKLGKFLATAQGNYHYCRLLFKLLFVFYKEEDYWP